MPSIEGSSKRYPSAPTSPHTDYPLALRPPWASAPPARGPKRAPRERHAARRERETTSRRHARSHRPGAVGKPRTGVGCEDNAAGGWPASQWPSHTKDRPRRIRIDGRSRRRAHGCSAQRTASAIRSFAIWKAICSWMNMGVSLILPLRFSGGGTTSGSTGCLSTARGSRRSSKWPLALRLLPSLK